MSIFKCKMCGGDLEIAEGASVAECQYCGSKQTLPRFDSDRKRNLYDRANHFRRNNEFDKAEGIYEQILNEDPTDAEAYWSLVLCRYGIEYVEDPTTHKRVPTVNRAQYTSVFADENYKKAIECADALQKSIYEDEAKTIDDIQRGILEISEKEEPFDVFICYKETDTQGRRTPDSVLANELYHELTKEGFKVFFSRITLEDKLGTAYEPYIFAALNSARVMVALGTKPEYFNAVWVKNEWSRYLALIRAGAKKNLIPAYRDMDPYDLPEEFSHLQAQDMSKLGFMPDLIRGIKKLLGADEPKEAVKETVVVQQSPGGANITAQLKRGMQALEDRDWDAADSFFDKALDMDAECAEAFFGKALAAAKCTSGEELVQKRLSFSVTEPEMLTACEKDTQRIKEAVDRLEIPDFFPASKVESCFSFDQRFYPSMTKTWKKRIDVNTDFWENDHFMGRATHYAKEEFREKLSTLRDKSEQTLQSKLAESMEVDHKQAEEVSQRYIQEMESALNNAEAEYEKAIERREITYQDFCRRQENASLANEFEALVTGFESPGMHGYKDSVAHAEQCRVKAKQLRELESKEAERIETARLIEAAKALIKASEESIDARKKTIRKNIMIFSLLITAAIGSFAGGMVILKAGDDGGFLVFMSFVLGFATIIDLIIMIPTIKRERSNISVDETTVRETTMRLEKLGYNPEKKQ